MLLGATVTWISCFVISLFFSNVGATVGKKKPTVHKRVVEESELSVPVYKEALTEVTVKSDIWCWKCEDVGCMDGWMDGWNIFWWQLEMKCLNWGGEEYTPRNIKLWKTSPIFRSDSLFLLRKRTTTPVSNSASLSCTETTMKYINWCTWPGLRCFSMEMFFTNMKLAEEHAPNRHDVCVSDSVETRTPPLNLGNEV